MTQSEVLARYLDVKERTLAASANKPVHLIVASKTQSIESIRTVYEAGQRDFGENYVQELLQKFNLARQLGMSDIRWHLIGHLQSNKAKAISPIKPIIHAVDRDSIVKALAKNHMGQDPIEVFLEVNVDHQQTKSGVLPENLEPLVKACESLGMFSILGLMCIPDPERDATSAFGNLRILKDQLGNRTKGYLSMGMSSDYELAIRMGATHVRVGTSIFGKREI